MDRFVDQGFTLLHWANQIEVICPGCGETGLVKGNPKWRHWQGTFVCPHCAKQMKTGEDHWQGPVLATAQRPCQACGHKWVRFEKRYPHLDNACHVTEQASCPQCHASNDMELNFYRASPEHEDIDPYFGLTLALREETPFGVVWAYNATHLDALRSYVTAKLRENSYWKWSYFVRLPAWIKSAKHRDTVLQAIARLQQRAKTTVTNQ